MRRTWLTFLALLAMAISPAAWAQLELGIDGGLMDFGNNLVDDEGPRVSLRGGWSFNDWFAVEGQLARSTADAFDTQLDTVTVNGIVNFRPHMVVQPYLMGGFGFSSVEQDTFVGGSEVTVEDDGMATVGALGAKTFFGGAETFGLRLEAGFVWEDTFSGSTTHITWSAGLIYRMDF